MLGSVVNIFLYEEDFNKSYFVPALDEAQAKVMAFKEARKDLHISENVDLISFLSERKADVLVEHLKVEANEDLFIKAISSDLYYNPNYLYLSGRGYRIISKLPDGKIRIVFPTCNNKEMDVGENELNGSLKEACDKLWQCERIINAKKENSNPKSKSKRTLKPKNEETDEPEKTENVSEVKTEIPPKKTLQIVKNDGVSSIYNVF